MAEFDIIQIHDVVNPSRGDGSCWITPDGYVPLHYEDHHDALVALRNDELYSHAYRHGWIRVGIHNDYLDIVLDGDNVQQHTLEYLHRILTPLLRSWTPRLEDRHDDYYKCKFLQDPHEIREHINSLRSRFNNTAEGDASCSHSTAA